MKVFEKAKIGHVELKNRIIRAATFEGLADDEGIVGEKYIEIYKKLSKNNVGGIITGFSYVSRGGKAVHPGQVGIDNEKQIIYLKKMTDAVHEDGAKIFLQIAHTGRQTMKKITGEDVVSSSEKASVYFKDKPVRLTRENIKEIVKEFGMSALRAKEAGFDGVEIHAAHGYLIHQFLLPVINDRSDEYGVNTNTEIGERFLGEIIYCIREKCRSEFAILVKISGSDDYRKSFSEKQFINLIKFLDEKKVSAIEISYGTMDDALNIFRGGVPINKILDYNLVYGRKTRLVRKVLEKVILPVKAKMLKKFSPMYNLEYALIAKKHTDIPIISVGGFRKGEEIEFVVSEQNIDFVSLCRPFIIEPDFVVKLENNEKYISRCSNCNQCAIMCDSGFGLTCYLEEEKNEFRRKDNRNSK